MKPKVRLVGEDGNVFNLLAICSKALKNAGMQEEATKLQKDVLACGNYDEALRLMMEACDVE